MPIMNGVMMQFFHWYSPTDGSLWSEVAARAPELAEIGFTALWLPPAFKGILGPSDVGYGVYDLYDLGEFDQKGTIRTKYGTRKEYLTAIQTVQRAGMQVYTDVVLNHRIGGDSAETVCATPFAQQDRIIPVGPSRRIRPYTHFHFPGRAGRHSQFEWQAHHFDAVDYDEWNPNDKNTIYLLEGKTFDDQVALEKGNFAFLLGCDLDFQSPEVRQEITAWGRWYLDTTQADGFRLDAVKHIAAWFFPEWIDAMERHAGKDLFVVAEYWTGEIGALHWYLDRLGGRLSTFDVPLHFRFHAASRSGGHFDMRRIMADTLMEQRPTAAVTFVDNHDSQPLQSLESPVEPWFKPLAYAFILLRQEGYPCVFAPDYFGAEYEDLGKDGGRQRVVLPSHRWLIDRFIRTRRDHAWGPQIDYFDHPNIIGWTRLGDPDHPLGLAVLLSDGPGGAKWMDTAQPHTTFVDITGHITESVTTNADGWGEFLCPGGAVSVWVPHPNHA